jgi:hypothetical protein
MFVVQIIISIFSLGGFIMMLVSLPGFFNLPHVLSLAGFLLTLASIFLRRRWAKAALFISGALAFVLFLGFLVTAMNAVS